MAAQCQHAPPPADFESHAVPSGTRLTLTLPDDFHHHFRDGPKVPDVLRLATQRFGRAIAMPNLQPVSSMICNSYTIIIYDATSGGSD